MRNVIAKKGEGGGPGGGGVKGRLEFFSKKTSILVNPYAPKGGKQLPNYDTLKSIVPSLSMSYILVVTKLSSISLRFARQIRRKCLKMSSVRCGR